MDGFLTETDRASTMQFREGMRHPSFPCFANMECLSMPIGEVYWLFLSHTLLLILESTSPTAAGFFSGKVTSDSINQRGSRWDTTVMRTAFISQPRWLTFLVDSTWSNVCQRLLQRNSLYFCGSCRQRGRVGRNYWP